MSVYVGFLSHSVQFWCWDFSQPNCGFSCWVWTRPLNPTCAHPLVSKTPGYTLWLWGFKSLLFFSPHFSVSNYFCNTYFLFFIFFYSVKLIIYRNRVVLFAHRIYIWQIFWSYAKKLSVTWMNVHNLGLLIYTNSWTKVNGLAWSLWISPCKNCNNLLLICVIALEI